MLQVTGPFICLGPFNRLEITLIHTLSSYIWLFVNSCLPPFNLCGLMESSSQLIGDAEECSSSESGWTMYLASPMHDDDDDDDDDDNMHDDGGGDGEVDQGHDDAGAGYYCESSGSSNASVGCNEADHGDDSLASDASTGPAQKIKPCSKCDGTDALDYPKDDLNGDDDDDDDNEIYSQFSSSLYKRKEEVEKRGDGKSPRPFLKGGASSSRSSSKVIKGE